MSWPCSLSTGEKKCIHNIGVEVCSDASNPEEIEEVGCEEYSSSSSISHSSSQKISRHNIIFPLPSRSFKWPKYKTSWPEQ